MKLIPQVKKLEIKKGRLLKKGIAPFEKCVDFRLKKAIEKLPTHPNGAKLSINAKDGDGEKYTLEIFEDEIKITSDGLRGAFWGIQTLRQIFLHDDVPCLYIEDEPDFEYRGLYHDITRGKVPTLETLKKLVDHMAYFKMNALQVYVEHVFEFFETSDIIQKTGYITKDEIRALDEYCRENFIEFTPSIATFGHMYEILEDEKFQHLRVLKDYKTPANFWLARMQHHTIDPCKEESFELVKSLIDQYYPLFESDKFNICCDETFDLEETFGKDSSKYYIDFVKKIVSHVQGCGKKVMMWADILLNHPETIEELPSDVYYLNWAYGENPNEKNIEKFAQLKKKQIVCPGTSSWSRFCERVDVEEKNICKMIDYGYKHGALGVLNTNWGDFGNPASVETSLYGIVLGAAKSWSVKTNPDNEFHSLADSLVYRFDGAFDTLSKLSDAHTQLAVNWNGFCCKYFEVRYGEEPIIAFAPSLDTIKNVQNTCLEVINKLSGEKWGFDGAREEMILCAEGLSVISYLGGKTLGFETEETVDTNKWLEKFRETWLLKNKESELAKIEEMILYVASL